MTILLFSLVKCNKTTVVPVEIANLQTIHQCTTFVRLVLECKLWVVYFIEKVIL